MPVKHGREMYDGERVMRAVETWFRMAVKAMTDM